MARNNYVGARSIEELAAALEKFSYAPRTEQERRNQSENLYRNQLEQALLSAQQQYETSDVALRNQLTGLGTAAQRQIDAQRENTRRAISDADRRALQRGMQRSGYNNAVLSNLQVQGNKAEAQIEEARTNQEQNIAAQRALLAQQLAQNQTAANSQFQNAVVANMQQLEQQDYERRLAADTNNNNTQLQLYQAAQNDFQNQLAADRLQQDNDQFNLNLALQREQLAENTRQFDANLAENTRQFDLNYGLQQARANGSGGTGGTSKSNGATGDATDDAAAALASALNSRDYGGAPANNAVSQKLPATDPNNVGGGSVPYQKLPATDPNNVGGSVARTLPYTNQGSKEPNKGVKRRGT